LLEFACGKWGSASCRARRGQKHYHIAIAAEKFLAWKPAPTLYQRDLLCVSVPEGMARPGRPPRPSRRSLDRNPPKPGWADLFSKITIGIFVEARIVE
jgi:hypothetical protein